MTNDVTIHVKWSDTDGDKFAAAQKARAKKAGQAAGDEFANSFAKAGVGAGKQVSEEFEKETKARPPKLPVKADNPIDAAWRKSVEAAIRRTASGAIKIPATADTASLRQDLEAALKKAATLLKAEIPVDPGDAAEFRAKLEAMVERAEAGVKAQIEVEVDEDSANASAAKAGKAVDGEMSRVAKRANAAFDGAKYAGLTLGLPAAAAAGAAGTALVLSGISAGFAGMAVAGLSSNQRVQSSFSELKTSVVSDVQAMSAPLEGTVVGAIDHVGDAWTRLRPQIAAGVQASAPAIDELAGSVTDFAEGAMPGMVRSVKSAEPALKGFRSFAGQAGEGLGEFAENVSEGSEAAGSSMEILGHTVATAESRVGTVLANLAKNSEGPLRSLDVVVDQLTGGFVDLTAQGSGVVGALGGAATAGSGVVTVLRGVATAAAALPPQVTQFAGAIGVSGMLLSKFGVDAGASFEGLGSKIKSADGAGAKLKTGLAGLAAGALSPATVATAGLGVALLVMGQDAERAQRAQATLAASQRTFTDALRESKGAIDDNVRASVSQDLAQKTINGNSKSLLDFAKQFGIALPQVTSAVVGEAGALEGVNAQLDAYAKANPDAATTVNALKVAIAAKGVAFREGTDAIAAEASATDKSTDAQNRNKNAINATTEAIYQQQNAQLGYRGAVLNSKQALDEYSKTSKDGKASEDDKAGALLRVEQAFAAQEKAAYDAAFANSASKDETVRTTEALAAQNREAVNLANSFQGTLPQSLEQTIGKMTTAQARAAGLTVAVDGTGAAVYRLPNGKEIRIAANTGQAMAAVNEVLAAQNALRNKEVTYTIVNRVVNLSTSGGAYQPSLSGRRAYGASGGLVKNLPTKAFAMGGLTGLAAGGTMAGVTMMDITGGGLLRGPGTGTSDSIRAMSSRGPVDTSTGEFVIRASQTRKWRPLLEDINAGVQGFAGGGMVQYGSVPQGEWDALYASGWRGDPTDGKEALYPPAGWIQAEDGSWVNPSFYGPAPKGPHAIYTASGFAKLRAAATANGIGSLSQMDQDQLRTYGGWTDSAPPAPARSGASTRGGYRGSAGAAQPVNVTLSFDAPRDDLGRAIVEYMRNYIRVSGGGSVQTALGQR